MRLLNEILTPISNLYFAAFVLSEVLIFLMLNFMFNKPFKNSIENLSIGSYEILNDFTGTVERILQNELNRMSSDLLLIRQHTNFYFENKVSQNFKKTYESLIGNVIEIDNTPTNLFENQVYGKLFSKFFNKTTGKFEYLESFLNSFEKNASQSYLIDMLLRSRSQYETMSYKPFTNTRASLELKNALCFATSMMKSILVKRFIVYRDKISFHRFVIVMNQPKDVFVFPPELVNNTFISMITSQRLDEKDCFPRCISLEEIDKKTSDTGMIMLTPNIINQKILFSICMKVSFVQKDDAYICGDIDLTNSIKHLSLEVEGRLNFALYWKIIETSGTSSNQFFVFSLNHSEMINNSFQNIELKGTNLSLFHFFYEDILIVNIELSEIEKKDVLEEFNEIKKKLDESIQSITNKFNENPVAPTNLTEVLVITKTFIFTSLGGKKKMEKDYFLLVISPVIAMKSMFRNEFFMGKDKEPPNYIVSFSLTVLSLSGKNTYHNIKVILRLKLLKLSLFLVIFLITWLIIFFLINNSVFKYCFSSIKKIKKEIKVITKLNDKKSSHDDEELMEILMLNKKDAKNFEMFRLEELYDTMKKFLILRQTLLTTNIDLYKKMIIQMIDSIKDEEIKDICLIVLANYNLRKGKYFSSFKYFHSLIHSISHKKEGNISDSQIKDIIQRFSEISYINEQSTLNGINEVILPIIKQKFFRQKVFYMFAYARYKDVVDSRSGSIRPYIENTKFIEEAIEYFKKAKDINSSLGVNPIKVVFCLVMMSKCLIYNKDYKGAKNFINESLFAFNEIQKLFKDGYKKYFNPRVMLFIMDGVFHSIMLTLAQGFYENNKPFLSGWIIQRVFTTSFFLHCPIHRESSELMCKIIKKIKEEGNNSKTRNFEVIMSSRKPSQSHTSKKTLKMFEKQYNLYNKIFSRLLLKRNNTKNLKRVSTTTGSLFASRTRDSKTSSGRENKESEICDDSINNMKKEIVICISETTFQSLNGTELKDVLIKCLHKFYKYDEVDMFSYIQFNSNGNKTMHLKPQKIGKLLQKLELIRSDSYSDYGKRKQFHELYNILSSCIKSTSLTIKGDNILILFLEASQLRFNSKTECVEIINELNSENFSVFFCCFDDEIDEEKIKNIRLLLAGLSEGYFLHMKNFSFIKQLFSFISSKNKQDNFNDFNFVNVNNSI